MAEILGPLTIQDKALPVGVDGARIAQWMLSDSMSYGELVNQVSLALGEANQKLFSKWSWLFNITQEIFMEYPNGGTVHPMTKLTDVDRHPIFHGTTIGHMLPIDFYGDAVGGTWRYFRNKRPAQIMAAITNVVNRGIWAFEQGLLSRIFTIEETAIGSAGYNVPFVRGTGGAVDFAPPAYDGTSFATSHNHYLGYDIDTGPDTLDDLLEGMAATLAEHGHLAPFTALVSRANIATYQAFTNFVTIVDPTVTYIDRAGATTGSQLFVRGQRDIAHIGYYQTAYGLVELVASNRIPTQYAAMVKSYGSDDPRNPLAVRVHPDSGFGFSIETKTSENLKWPVEEVDVDFEFGVGVGQDRTNGAAAFLVTDATYVSPTIA
jgi:hypothetical protein